MDEEGEDSEAMMFDVRLMQTKLRQQKKELDPQSLPPTVLAEQQALQGEPPRNSSPTSGLRGRSVLAAGAPAETEAAAGEGLQEQDRAGPAAATSLVSLDHNGNVCILCGKPLPERVGNKTYAKSETTCGGRSSPTGPTADDLNLPVAEISRSAGRRGGAASAFCELNFGKSCVDAAANKDYLYWAKSLDMNHPDMRGNIQWDAGYCQKNGFLQPAVVALQHNFTGMHEKARELCGTRYAKYGTQNLTFVDMLKRSHAGDAPSDDDAELLAAWNCAMGDLGCDMAWCAYTFCERGSTGSFGLYDECAGWHPVQGMPVPSSTP